MRKTHRWFCRPDGTALGGARRTYRQPGGRELTIAAVRLCRTVSCGHRRPLGAPARSAGRARPHLRPAGSAPADASTAWCWAVLMKAAGRRRHATIPGSRARCAPISVSIRRSGASALAAHDFAQALGAPEVILARAAKVAGAPTVARASCSGSPRSPANAWSEVTRTRRHLSRLGARA